jgi:acetyl-CoA carboxylase biotin carboxylase subunit
LLTNDGELAAMLTHPRHQVDRTYEAHVAGMPDDEAIDRLRRALSEFVVKGITTNIAYLRQIIDHPEFRSGDYDTTFLARRADELKIQPSPELAKVALMASALHQFQLDQARSKKLQERTDGAQGARSRWAEIGRMHALGRGGVR